MPFEPPKWYEPDLPAAGQPEIDAAPLYPGTPPPALGFLESPPGPEPGQDDGLLDAGDTGFWKTDLQTGNTPFNWYMIAVRRVRRHGLYGMPEAAGKGGRTHVVRTHTPTAMFVVSWLAERVGAKPVLPHWDLSAYDPNLVLQYDDILPEAPHANPDGRTHTYRVRGTYVYLMQYAPADEDSILVPTIHLVTTPAAEHTLGAEQWDRALLSGVLSQGYASPEEVNF